MPRSRRRSPAARDVPHVVAAACKAQARARRRRPGAIRPRPSSAPAAPSELYTATSGDSWQVAMAVGSPGLLPGRRVGSVRRGGVGRHPRRSPASGPYGPTPTWSMPSTTRPCGSCTRPVSPNAVHPVLLGTVVPETRAVPSYWRSPHYLVLEAMLTDPTQAQAIEQGRHLTTGRGRRPRPDLACASTTPASCARRSAEPPGGPLRHPWVPPRQRLAALDPPRRRCRAGTPEARDHASGGIVGSVGRAAGVVERTRAGHLRRSSPPSAACRSATSDSGTNGSSVPTSAALTRTGSEAMSPRSRWRRTGSRSATCAGIRIIP